MLTKVKAKDKKFLFFIEVAIFIIILNRFADYVQFSYQKIIFPLINNLI